MTYTPSQVAKELQIHVKTVLKWIRDGELKHVKLGERSIRVTEEQLREFLERKTK